MAGKKKVGKKRVSRRHSSHHTRIVPEHLMHKKVTKRMRRKRSHK